MKLFGKILSLKWLLTFWTTINKLKIPSKHWSWLKTKPQSLPEAKHWSSWSACSLESCPKPRSQPLDHLVNLWPKDQNKIIPRLDFKNSSSSSTILTSLFKKFIKAKRNPTLSMNPSLFKNAYQKLLTFETIWTLRIMMEKMHLWWKWNSLKMRQ